MLPEPSDRFDRANRIFSEALEVSEGERREFVRRNCPDDALFDEVMAMITRHAELGSFLAEPLMPDPQRRENEFRVGETLNHRFRILEMIGRGGMGSVYRAKDDLSGETVAIKTLGSRYLGSSAAEERFRQELTLARKVSHVNVCRIHELFDEVRQSGRILYFTMEYLDGEVLSERLREGPIAAAEALAIARQAAAGLDAAHAAGIIHRDLKPSNIFLAAERVVVTDFGLAKALKLIEAGEGQTITGQVPGTAAYMSPEQFLGEDLKPQSDVFAFGLVVFEMLTGRAPFPREDVGSTMRRACPAVPRGWDRVIDRALASDPERRYGSAGAMVHDLERTQGKPGAIEIPWPRRKVLYGGGLMMTAAAGFVMISRLRNQGITLPASPLVMLTPLTHSADTLNAQTVDLLLSGQLKQSAHIRLLPADAVIRAWQRIRGSKDVPPEQFEPRTARDIALRQSADFVVFGNLGKTGDEYVLRLQVELMGADPGHARKTWSRDFVVQGRADLPSAAFEGASWVRGTIGESSPELRARSRRPEEITTASWQALEEFTKSDQAWLKRDSAAALLHLRTALDLDPGFALAAFRMADILAATNRGDEALPYYQAAAELVRKKNLTDRESLRIRGMFLLDTRQEAEAERTFARWALDYPRDPLPFFYKATSVERQGRLEEALALGRRALELEPLRAVFVQGNAERLLAAGRMAEAEAGARRLQAMDATDWTDILLSALAVGRGDTGEAWLRLEHLRGAGSPNFQSRAYVFQACFRAEQRRYGEAEHLYREGIAFDAANGMPASEPLLKKRQLAQLLLRQRRTRESAEVCREILAARCGNQLTMETGCVLARAGDMVGAGNCLPQDLPDWPLYRHWVLRLQGEIALAQGNSRRALELLREAPLMVLGAWREDLLDAAVAAGDQETARAQAINLFSNPARAWRTAQFSSPGFFSHAAEVAEKLDLPVDPRKNLELLKRGFGS